MAYVKLELYCRTLTQQLFAEPKICERFVQIETAAQAKRLSAHRTARRSVGGGTAPNRPLPAPTMRYPTSVTIQLKIRHIESSETLVAEFANLDDAEAWLRERPQFVEVIGSIGLTEADSLRLRAALRELDEDERAMLAAQDAVHERSVREALARESEEAEAALAKRRIELGSADPNRPMLVAWTRDQGCRNGDPADPRELSERARAAVIAWVRERDSWVHPRGQCVATADLVVWPGPIPDGDEDERVHPGGQFSAVSMDHT
jgi:hypothetical protein